MNDGLFDFVGVNARHPRPYGHDPSVTQPILSLRLMSLGRAQAGPYAGLVDYLYKYYHTKRNNKEALINASLLFLFVW